MLEGLLYTNSWYAVARLDCLRYNTFRCAGRPARTLERHSSSGQGHRPLKAEITGSNPVCPTINNDAGLPRFGTAIPKGGQFYLECLSLLDCGALEYRLKEKATLSLFSLTTITTGIAPTLTSAIFASNTIETTTAFIGFTPLGLLRKWAASLRLDLNWLLFFRLKLFHQKNLTERVGGSNNGR